MKHRWYIENSIDLYFISKWGNPYFSINKMGHVICTLLSKKKYLSIDLKYIVNLLKKKCIDSPFLIRFNDILYKQTKSIFNNFKKSIKKFKYDNIYQCIFPIKVNQQSNIVERLLKNKNIYIGLEIGSKPELLIAMTFLTLKKTILICNGCKDKKFIKMILDTQKISIISYIIIEYFEELINIIQISKKINTNPYIGLRLKVSTPGSGCWKDSSGDYSKFGLYSKDIIPIINVLNKYHMLFCLKLLHFHIGSQIVDIKSINNAIKESTQLYCNLRKIGCAGLNNLDLGGGLAIDYDGNNSSHNSSKNYSIKEYTNSITSTIQVICDMNKEPHPVIITESGRYLVTYHSILILNVLRMYNKVKILEKTF